MKNRYAIMKKKYAIMKNGCAIIKDGCTMMQNGYVNEPIRGIACRAHPFFGHNFCD